MHGFNIGKNIYTKSYINPITKKFDAFSLIAGNNIFWTLFLLMGPFLILDKITKEKKLFWSLSLLVLLPLILFSEGGFYLFPIALASYFFKNNPKKVSLAILVWSVVLLAKALISYYTYGREVMTLYQQLAYSNEFMMVTAIPFILSYNGKRGGRGRKWEKNLFYIFYPSHLIILNIISIMINGK